MTATTYQNALPIGSMLQEYRLDAVLGAGGFGMTYLGWDTHLEKHVAIKEYLPTDLAVRALDGSIVPITTELKHDYQWGLDRFILEARTLARFSHPHIVRVMRFFEANGTGYMVMEYEKGEPLSEVFKRAPQPDEARLKAIVLPLLDGLEAVHAAGFLHRDIKPGNIFLRENGSPVLIDFGAARHAIGGTTKSLTAVLTPGYAPLEQYASDGNQGPWSDIYAMGGVLYRALANDNPPDAVSRLKSDTLSTRLSSLRGRVSQPFLQAIEWALSVDEKQRPQSVPEWRRALAGGGPGTAAPAAAAPTVRAGNTAVAPTVVQPASRPPQPRRPLAQPPGPKSFFAGRWLGIGATVLIALVAIGAWNKHRTAAERERQETARIEAARAADAREARRAASPPGPVTGLAPPVVSAPGARDRPGREREERGMPRDEKLRQLEHGAEQEFRGADANKDGYLSPDEVRGRFPFIDREFRRVDSDGDGRISRDEFVQFRRLQAAQKFKKP